MEDIYNTLKPFLPSWSEDEDDPTRSAKPQVSQTCSPQWLYRDCLQDAPGLILSDSEDSTSCFDDFYTNPLHHRWGYDDKDTTPTHRRGYDTKDSGITENDEDEEETHHVRFATASVREYAVTIADQGCCMALPLTLDWEHSIEDRVYRIDDYEKARRKQRSPRGRLPKLDYWQRQRILQRVGPFAEAAKDDEVYEESHEVSIDEVPIDELRMNESLIEPTEEQPEAEPEYGAGLGFPMMKVEILED